MRVLLAFIIQLLFLWSIASSISQSWQEKLENQPKKLYDVSMRAICFCTFFWLACTLISLPVYAIMSAL